MKYAMLIHEKPGYVEALAEDEQSAVFAEYMALSACCSRSAAFSPFSGNMLIPTLALMVMVWLSIENGVDSTLSKLWATNSASSLVCSLVSTTVNSSPPSRESVSDLRIRNPKRSAT